MDMVGNAANGNGVSTNILYYASDIGENLPKVFLADGYTCILNVEDDVDVKFGVGVSHSLLFVIVMQGLMSPVFWSVTLTGYRLVP